MSESELLEIGFQFDETWSNQEKHNFSIELLPNGQTLHISHLIFNDSLVVSVNLNSDTRTYYLLYGIKTIDDVKAYIRLVTGKDTPTNGANSN